VHSEHDFATTNMIHNIFHPIMIVCTTAALITVFLPNSLGFVVNPMSLSSSGTSRVTHSTATHGLRMAVEEDLLDELTDHDEEGSRLATSIAGWLDEEWMPQEVHVKMGESAKRSFITARESGVNTVRILFACVQ